MEAREIISRKEALLKTFCIAITQGPMFQPTAGKWEPLPPRRPGLPRRWRHWTRWPRLWQNSAIWTSWYLTNVLKPFLVNFLSLWSVYEGWAWHNGRENKFFVKILFPLQEIQGNLKTKPVISCILTTFFCFNRYGYQYY